MTPDAVRGGAKRAPHSSGEPRSGGRATDASARMETAPKAGTEPGMPGGERALLMAPGSVSLGKADDSFAVSKGWDAPQPFWARPGMVAAAGETLRPGSFALTDRAAGLAGLAPGWRVLDVGSGLGATVRRLRARHGALAVGLERSGRQLRRMTAGSAPFVCGGMESMPFAAARFDMIFCECVLSLLERPEAGLAEARRVLRPGGVLALSDLYLKEGRRGEAGGSCAAGAMSREEVRDLLAGGGFEITHFEDHSRLLTELAARLIFAGEGTGAGNGERAGETGNSCGCAPRGYYLLLARRAG